MEQSGEPTFQTRAARRAAGKALREAVPREVHGDFAPDPGRDPLAILKAGDVTRMPSLVHERYRRMADTPFAFYRGAAAIMAQDLRRAPRIGAPVQACGDCHLMNFGAFLTPEDRVLFDVNDFDETYPGIDFIIDLKRLVASVAIAAEAAGQSAKDARALARAAAKAYRDFMGELAQLTPLEVWKVSINLADEIALLADAALDTKVLAKLVKASKDVKAADGFPAVAHAQGGSLKIVDKAMTIFHAAPDGTRAADSLNETSLARYRALLPPDRRMLVERYRLQDAAFKVVGVGSVGTLCAIGLLATADDDELVLQFKQSSPSVMAALAPTGATFANQGQRVVEGQRAMQAASDAFLGWTQDGAGHHFYIRQLKNRRLGSVADLLAGKALQPYATLCARTLARAHARTGDPALISGYIGGSDVLDEALARFSLAYTGQNKLDHAKLLASGLVHPDGAT